MTFSRLLQQLLLGLPLANEMLCGSRRRRRQTKFCYSVLNATKSNVIWVHDDSSYCSTLRSSQIPIISRQCCPTHASTCMVVKPRKQHKVTFFVPPVFTARCTLVQSAVLGSHVVHLSVCLSVRLWRWWIVITYICWKSCKLISRTISQTPSLFVAQTPSTYSQRNMGKFGGE